MSWVQPGPGRSSSCEDESIDKSDTLACKDEERSGNNPGNYIEVLLEIASANDARKKAKIDRTMDRDEVPIMFKTFPNTEEMMFDHRRKQLKASRLIHMTLFLILPHKNIIA